MDADTNICAVILNLSLIHISFSLPLKKQVFLPTKDYFSGLFGVFADSLPDNWGRLLLDRLIRAHKQAPDELTVLDRLAIVGKSGMGALTYYPEKSFSEQTGNLDLDELAEECQKILNTEYSDKLDELYRLGGTSGGTRPKIMTTINGEESVSYTHLAFTVSLLLAPTVSSTRSKKRKWNVDLRSW